MNTKQGKIEDNTLSQAGISQSMDDIDETGVILLEDGSIWTLEDEAPLMYE